MVPTVIWDNKISDTVSQNRRHQTLAHIFINRPIIGSRALSFKRPLLSVDVNVCGCVCPQLWGQISGKPKELAGKLLWGAYRNVVGGYRMVTSPMTSRDLMTSYPWPYYMQTLVHHISSFRKPTVAAAILSYIVGLNAPHKFPLPPAPSGSRLAAKVFSARQHICYSALYAIARPSVRLSVRHTGGSVKDVWS